MKKFISRKIYDLIYVIKRILAFPIDVFAYLFGGIPPCYYLFDRRQGELDARRYEDFCDEWLKKHPNKTIEDFDNDFAGNDKLDGSWSKDLRHDMICRTGIDIYEMLHESLADEIMQEELKNRT